METKVCTKCGEEKPLSLFRFRKDRNTYRNECNECLSAYMGKYKKERKEANENGDIRYRETKEYIKNQVHGYYIDHKDEADKRERIWRNANRDRVRGYDAKQSKTERRKQGRRDYYLENKDSIMEWNRKYRTRKYREDIQFNLAMKIRRRIWSALKLAEAKKSDKTINILGCSFDEYSKYIESLFTDNMTWGKVKLGEIHIDHIIPVCSFNLTDAGQLAEAFNYKNTQPMWAKDNYSKSSRMPDGTLARHVA